MALLKNELELFGYNNGPEAFLETVGELFIAMYPSWTDEELLVNPSSAIDFCKAVQHRTNMPTVPHRLILRALTNLRKAKNRHGEAPDA